MDKTVIDRVRSVMETAAPHQAAFAERVGLTPDKLSKSLKGTRRFTSLDLARIAEAGATTVDWLLTGREPLQPSFAARRNASAPGDVERDALPRLIERFTAAYEVLELLGSTPELPPLPTVRSGLDRYVDQGRALAEDALAMLARAGVPDVAELETGELIQALEQVFGIDVAKLRLPEGVDGVAWQADGFRLVMTAADPAWTRQRFTLAHELGHILAQDAQDMLTENHLRPGRQKDWTEARANVFAADFLMPRAAVTAAAGQAGPSDDDFRSLVVRFKVSPSALAARLGQLGIIDQETRNRLRGLTARACHVLSGRGEIHEDRTAWSQAHRMPPRPAEGLYAGYLAGESTLRPLAAYLDLDVDEIRSALDPEPAQDDLLPSVAEEGDLVFQP